MMKTRSQSQAVGTSRDVSSRDKQKRNYKAKSTVSTGAQNLPDDAFFYGKVGCSLRLLPGELKCDILSHLSLVDVSKMALMDRSWRNAVSSYLGLMKILDFADYARPKQLYQAVSRLNDCDFAKLLSRCPLVHTIRNFHPVEIIWSSCDFPFANALSFHGITEGLKKMKYLTKIDISNLELLECIAKVCPHLSIPVFANKNGRYPPLYHPTHRLSSTYRVTELDLFGVQVNYSLPLTIAMPHVTKFHVQCVRFTNGLKRGSRFHCPNIKSFMMSNCIWPLVDMDHAYGVFCTGLASCKHLEVMHLVGTALDARLFRRIIEANWQRFKPFSKLKKLVLASNPLLHEDDIGALCIASQKTLETLYIQKSLSKDVVMVAMETARPYFWSLKRLMLGYVDELSPRDHYNYGDRLTSLDEDFELMSDNRPCQLSDCGIKSAASAMISNDLTSLSINECPYLNNPVSWIPNQGFGPSLWHDLTELTLSRCPTISLDRFNEFMDELYNIRVLNLYHMFPPPPKGCASVGLSAGMNIGGPHGIRAIISQPPVLSQNSLLTFPAIDVSELMKMDNISDSEEEDNSTVAESSQGYRTGQMHASCSTTSARIRRAFVRNEKKMLEEKVKAAKPKPDEQVVDLRRYRCKPRRTTLPLRRKSKRVRDHHRLREGKACDPEEESEEEPELLDIRDDEENVEAGAAEHDKPDQEAGSPSPDLILPPEYDHKQINKTSAAPQGVAPPPDVALAAPSSPKPSHSRHPDHGDKSWKTDGKDRNNASLPDNRKPVGSGNSSSSHSSNQYDDISNMEVSPPGGDPSDLTCVVCGRSLPTTTETDIITPTGIQISGRRRRSSCSILAKQIICKQCMTERIQEAKSRRHYPSDSLLIPPLCPHQNVQQWIVFNSISGTAQLCTADNTERPDSKQEVTSNKCKGKAPLKPRSHSKVKSHSDKSGVKSGRKGRRRVGKDPSAKSGGARPAKNRRMVVKLEDKCVGTEDPFIEPDTKQVLSITNALSKLDCLNLIDTGITAVHLSSCELLSAITAHACPVLKELQFSKAPGSYCPSRVAKITQCPKMTLSGLLESVNSSTADDNTQINCLRTIQYEPLSRDEYDREEVLVELSSFPEHNKILIESFVTGACENGSVKTYYEELITQMSGCGNPGYLSDPDYRIYAEDRCEGRLFISHNIPQCKVRITPYCDLSPSHVTSQHMGRGAPATECLVTSASGHVLRGGTVFCFVYPPSV